MSSLWVNFELTVELLLNILQLETRVGTYYSWKLELEHTTVEHTTVGNYSCEQTTVGNYSFEQTTVGNYSCEQTTVGNYSCEQTTVGNYSCEQTTVEHTTVGNYRCEQKHANSWSSYYSWNFYYYSWKLLLGTSTITNENYHLLSLLNRATWGQGHQ